MTKLNEADNLEQALCSFLGESQTVCKLTRVLLQISSDARILYEVIEQIAGEDVEEVILLGYKWRILVPAKTSMTIDWESSVMLFNAGETYKVPDIIAYMVGYAAQTGQWETKTAITSLFRLIGEPAWKEMANIVAKMYQLANFHRINGAQIAKIANELGLIERADPIITELKGVGIMHPRPNLVNEMIKVRAPIYELNPSLFSSRPVS